MRLVGAVLLGMLVGLGIGTVRAQERPRAVQVATPMGFVTCVIYESAISCPR